MVKIEVEQISTILHLIDTENGHYPLLKAILSGRKKGDVYVNRLGKPSSACTISDDGWLYFLGDENDSSFNAKLESFIMERVTKKKKDILWFGISEIWRKKLGFIDSLKIGDFPRIQYEFNRGSYSSCKTRNFPYQLEPINDRNVEKLFEHNDGIKSFWTSHENFINHGIGFILMDNERIIGHAISASVEDGEVEIDIESDKLYRGKGIAIFLTSCLIDECLKRGLIPKWDCAAANIPSKKLALKLGFKELKKYPFSYITSK